MVFSSNIKLEGGAYIENLFLESIKAAGAATVGQVATVTGPGVIGFQDAFLKNGGTMNGNLNVQSLMVGSGTRTSLHHCNGSEASNVTTTTVAMTLAEHYYLIAYGASNYTITFPAASSCVGRCYAIKCRNGNKTTSITYVGVSGNLSNVLTAGSVMYFVSDGTDWQQF